MSTVAAVVRCRDAGRALDRAVEAIAAQLELGDALVVVDDGSTDLFTLERLPRLPAASARVHRLPAANAASAWNLGVAETQQDLVLWVEADIELPAGFLARARGLLDASPKLDAVLVPVQRGGAGGWRWVPAPSAVPELLARGVAPPACLLRRALWDSLSGQDETLPEHGPLDFWVRAALAGATVQTLDGAPARPLAPAGGSEQWTPARLPLQPLLARHRESLRGLEVEAVVAFEADVRARQEQTDAAALEAVELERELARLGERRAALLQALAARGAAPMSWGLLGGTSPVSPLWALDRGKPVDRHYIEQFLARHAGDVRGEVLEVKNAGYTRRYGEGRVGRAHVLDLDAANPEATLVADLARPETVPEAAYDCFILTQTVHIIFELREALRTAVRSLRPGGVLLCTLPTLGRINFENGGLDAGDYWRFTEAAVRRLFAELVPPEAFEVTAYGNVKACTAFLQGLATEELSAADLAQTDPWHPLLYAVRVVKPLPLAARAGQRPGPRAAILLYHRVTEGPRAGSVPSALFAAHLELLRRDYQPLALDALVDGLASGDLPPRAVAITFDDGTLDALEVASPRLVAASLPATFFVSSGGLEAPVESWHDAVARALLESAQVPEELRLAVEGAALQLPTRTRRERERARAEIERHFRRAANPVRRAVLAQLQLWSGVDTVPRASHRLLTRAEVVALAGRPGHQLGSHGVRHLALTALAAGDWKAELCESRAALEQVTGRPVAGFAYPYGEYSDGLALAVGEAGYAWALTTQRGLVDAQTPRALLGRVEVGAWSVERLGACLQELFDSGRGG